MLQGQQVVDAVKAVCANSTEAFNQTADTNMSVSCMLPPGQQMRRRCHITVLAIHARADIVPSLHALKITHQRRLRYEKNSHAAAG